MKWIKLILFVVMANSCSQDFDPCLVARCNNGYCEDGECICNVSHTGTNCMEQNTPSKIIFRKVSFFNLPILRPDSSAWDLDENIDPYLLISEGSKELYRTEYERDVSNYEFFTYSMYLRVLEVKNALTISIIDKDLNGEESVSSFSFVPYSDNNGFPSQLSYENEAGTKLLIEVIYEF